MQTYYVVSRIKKLVPEANVVSPTTGNTAGTPIIFKYSTMSYVSTQLHNAVPMCLYIPQQMNEMTTINEVEILPKMMSFLNMRTASAPIQNIEVRVKYWIRTEATVQPMVFSV